VFDDTVAILRAFGPAYSSDNAGDGPRCPRPRRDAEPDEVLYGGHSVKKTRYEAVHMSDKEEVNEK
jgi:hypothetical protein